MDNLTKNQRRRNMSGIRSKNTTPEIRVRSLLHRHGFRFRLHRKDLAGTPDIVLPKFRTAIFVHGCFWHRHEGCKYAATPKTRADFWQKKFESNIDRDINVRKALQKQGWKVFVIWECELRDQKRLIENFQEIVTQKGTEE